MATRPTYTQSQLKALVKDGVAKDITMENKRRAGVHVIGVSYGIYGANGLLLKGGNGKLYAVIGRGNALFLYL